MKIRNLKSAIRCGLLASVLVAGVSSLANPQGMTVVSGSATVTQHGNVLQITTSRNAVLNWNNFNIPAGDTTIFREPSANSIVFNNIGGANASAIFGSLQANGIVVLENSHGFYFGPNAFVKAGGLVVTTAAVNPWGAAGGAGWSFDGPPPAVPIVNYGHLETATGGSLYLIANEVDNHGTISAPGGTAALLAGQDVMLSTTPDGLSLAVPVHLPAGSVNNEGKITADAGQILLQAQTVNNSGVVQADSLRERNGVIEFYASQDIQLSATSVIQANGDAGGNSPGGNITIKSDGTFSDAAGSRITATGGANGGNGGNVEVSAPSVLSLNSAIDTGAHVGSLQGAFSLDPENIVLGATGTTGAGSSGTINGTGSSGSLTVNVNSAFENITSGQILLEASGNITLGGGTTWNLSQTTGETSGLLTLEAGGNIIIGASQNAAVITDAHNWSVTLEAGYNFATGSVSPGVGTVTVSPGGGTSFGGVRTAAGNITVLAGNNVTLQGDGGLVTGIAGSVMPGGGGNVSVQALSGTVNCGTSTVGYKFNGGLNYTVSTGLGGISTAAGGNVTIQAGQNIVAPLPSGQRAQTDYGSGAFGAEPGNVTLTASGDITGHYVLADGTGLITASQDAGESTANLALSLIKGAWTVHAQNNIYLQEVRNPNGMFNGTLAGPNAFNYNYDPLASVTLNAGNGVTLGGGTTVPRVPNNLEAPIYPPSLSVTAGAGGITLLDDVNLYPSPVGTLTLTTTAGGSLNGNGKNINVSDSDSTRWNNSNAGLGNGGTFTLGDDGNNVLHLNDPNPDSITISGSVNDVTVYSPKTLKMYVADNIIDSSVVIKNLLPTDTSVISAGGEIFEPSPYVILALPGGETPNFAALAAVADPYVDAVTFAPTTQQNGLLSIPNPNLIPALQGLNLDFTYDPASRSLVFLNVMSPAAESALLGMRTPFLSANTIQQVYQESQSDMSAAGNIYSVTGPGTLKIIASSLNLGNSVGVLSLGPTCPAQVPTTVRGADIDISLSGDLSMLSSSIASEYGGTINITCGGAIEVGSPAVPPNSSISYPTGLVSLWQGDINVIANGDINVDGSRIAAYDGGNVFVESLYGNVDAGKGGNGKSYVDKPYVDAQGDLLDLPEFIPGSGILATSYPQLVYGESFSHVGNITVETPEGNIIASKGGISQLVLSPSDDKGTINLTAGSPGYIGSIEANGSGIVGGQVNLSATGDINGLVIASVGANVTALQNISATILSQGGVTVSAGGTVSGMVVGVGAVNVTGATDSAQAFSQTAVTTGGNVVGPATPSAAVGSNSASTAATSQQVTTTAQSPDQTGNSSDEDERKKKLAAARLIEYVGRVTVLLQQ